MHCVCVCVVQTEVLQIVSWLIWIFAVKIHIATVAMEHHISRWSLERVERVD